MVTEEVNWINNDGVVGMSVCVYLMGSLSDGWSSDDQYQLREALLCI